MLDPRLKEWIAKGYMKIGEISYSIALNMRKGKNGTPSQRSLYEQGIKISVILKVLFRQVTFDDNNVPTLWRITEVQVNKLTRCLVQLGELDKLPAAPALFPNIRPIILNAGATGGIGAAGTPGSNANIIVQLKSGEKQLKLTESIVGLVKIYELSFKQYAQQLLTGIIQGSKIFEVGVLVDFDLLITSIKGTETIVSITCDDSTANATLQGLLDLVAANNELSQPYQITVSVTGQASTQTFTVTSDDGETLAQYQDTINFYYPFLYGNNVSDTPIYYTALTKKIEVQGNKSFLFNGVDQYFFIAYPSSYGVLTKILSQNGYDVTSDFNSSLVNITSTGLDNNWVVEYIVYRTTLKTTIDNALYSIQF